MNKEAHVNFFCPELRGAFMRRPCEGFWAKIAEAREKWPNHQFQFPLNKCEDCKGDKLVPPEQKEKAVVEAEKGKMVRTQIHEAMERMIPTVGPTITKKDLSVALDIPVANLTYHLNRMHAGGLVKITSPGDGYPDQISWPTPKDAPLPDKAGNVEKSEVIIQAFQEECEKAGIVQEAPEVLRVPEVPEDPNPPDLTEVPEVVEAPHLPEAPGVRLCKNNDGRPAHKTSPYCLECCQENLKRNQEQAKAKPKANPGDLSAKERLFNWTLENLPAFDPTWAPEVWDRWLEVHRSLLELAKDL